MVASSLQILVEMPLDLHLSCGFRLPAAEVAEFRRNPAVDRTVWNRWSHR